MSLPNEQIFLDIGHEELLQHFVLEEPDALVQVEGVVHGDYRVKGTIFLLLASDLAQQVSAHTEANPCQIDALLRVVALHFGQNVGNRLLHFLGAGKVEDFRGSVFIQADASVVEDCNDVLFFKKLFHRCFNVTLCAPVSSPGENYRNLNELILGDLCLWITPIYRNLASVTKFNIFSIVWYLQFSILRNKSLPKQ